MSWSFITDGDAQLAPIGSPGDTATLLGQPLPLRLEVFINGGSTGKVEPFLLMPSRHLSVERRVLEELGIKVERQGGPADPVELSSLPDLPFRFDEARQLIDFTLTDKLRLPHAYDMRGPQTPLAVPAPEWGGVLDYSLFATDQGVSDRWFRFSGANATLNAQLFGPVGSISQTGILGNTVGRAAETLRLDSTYTYVDDSRLVTGRLGDTVSSGLAWTRPIRFGGVQVQRDFSLQPNLITQPLPSFSGSAAVPSSVDVFVNSVKTFSEKVEAGPYQIVNMPALTNGNARVVVTDTTGRQTQTSFALFSAPTLLRPSLLDFSVEAGFARRFYGLSSFDYDDAPLASATLRGGLNDWLTVESHAEAGAGLLNGGLGVVAGFERWGVVSGAAALSRHDETLGGQIYAAYDVGLWDMAFHANYQQVVGGYDDLAGVTARYARSGSLVDNLAYGLTGLALGSTGFDPNPPRHLGQVSVSAPVPLLAGSLGLSLIDLRDGNGTASRLVTATYSRSLPWRASLFASVYVDLVRRGSTGVTAGLSMPLGSDMSASVSGSGTLGPVVTASKTLGREAGSYGWQVTDIEDHQPYRSAEVAYRGGYGTAGLGVTQQGRSAGGSASLEGSVGAMGGSVAFGNRTSDSFALVDTGLPGVGVLQDNRPVGSTDPWGHLLVPDLHAYQSNRISIDPLTLPPQALTESTQHVVTPSRMGGVHVDFGGDKTVDAITIVLLDGGGKPLEPGSKGRVDATGESFVVGYGGQAYLRHPARGSSVTVDLGDRSCRATLPSGVSPTLSATEQPRPCL